MKKRGYTPRRLLIVLIIFLVLMGIFYLAAPKYVSRALIYQKVNIDDYEIFHNRRVKAEAPVPWQASEGNKEIPQQHLESMQEYKPVAFLVVKDKKIVSEHYWEGYDKESHSNAFSATKSIVSLLVGIAYDKGHIKSLDQPLGDYFPEYASGRKSEVTIRHLLTMSSGLSWDESYGSLFSTTTEAYYGTDISSLVMDLELVENPGEEFKYLSGNTQLLGLLVSEATGTSLSEFASRHLWTPVGAVQDALWSLDDEGGDEKAYCCFNSNARDFARIGQLVLDSGRAYGKQVISAEYLRQATSPASYLLDKHGEANNFYGYQWWIVNYKGHQVKYARGILGQYIFVIPDLNVVTVRLGHKRSKEYKEGHHPKDVFLYLDVTLDMLQ